MRNTRHLYICIIGFVVILSLNSFNQDTRGSIGAIGDIKYSLLPPDKFIELNGAGWILMSVNDDFKKSKLSSLGVASLPDARGMFFRTLNEGRNDGKEDPFTKENGRERSVGEYQADTLQSHHHSVEHFNDFIPRTGGSVNDIWINSTIDVTSNAGGTETRAKNIALFIYIKIN